ncbi:MAG: serine hydroxymethyltransferase [Pseudomonadota bacterium]
MTTQDAATRAHFFQDRLDTADTAVFAAIQDELTRQGEVIELIASENLTSRAVLQAQGGVMTNKYAEGYPQKRYYGGCENVDKVEELAIARAKAMFNCHFANVQPHSGSQANQAVYLALLQPGSTIVSLALDHGGHLTHGSPVNISGKWFDVHHYGVNPDGYIDYDEVERVAQQHRPAMLVCGASAYSRVIDWARMRRIADAVGSYLLADIAHYAGLIVGGAMPNPCEHCDVVTTTTHKTLRGPRGGMILWNDEKFTKPINSAVFPGLQGGPLMHVIAAKAVAFGQALQPQFREYARAVIDNARMLASTLQDRGYAIMSGGTDTHVMLIDLRGTNVTGKQAQESLGRAHLNCNRNTVPNDPQKAMTTSGIRLGSPAGTTRGFGTGQFTQIGNWIADVLDALKTGDEATIAAAEARTVIAVKELCTQYPIYTDAFG